MVNIVHGVGTLQDLLDSWVSVALDQEEADARAHQQEEAAAVSNEAGIDAAKDGEELNPNPKDGEEVAPSLHVPSNSSDASALAQDICTVRSLLQTFVSKMPLGLTPLLRLKRCHACD
jgi:hypothetical protein